MYFKREKNEFLRLLCFGATFFVAGMIFEDMLNLNGHIVTLIGIGIHLFAYIIYRLIVALNPLKRIERKINKQPYKHQQLKMYFDEYIPETKKSYPKKIYKYVSLTTPTDEEKNTLATLFKSPNLKKWIKGSSNRTINENKLYSLATDSLWFTRSNSATLNDPFEGRRNSYDDDLFPFEAWQIEYLKQFAENIRNNLFICCLSKNNDSPPMWANYANNYNGYCLEFEILDTNNLCEVYYTYGKNPFNFEYKGLENDLLEDKITRDEAYKYIEQLHIYWASSKHSDWNYEDEIRALFCNLNKDMNIAYETIGIKLSAIIVGHNCSKEYQDFLVYMAKRLSIPVKITTLNTTTNNYIDVINYDVTIKH